jgi:phosphoribosyl 1,2-cyclic phosphodiesterase
MLRTSVLSSGSKGNANLIFTDNTYLLLDAGLSAKRIFEAMQAIDLDYNKLNGIIISHEHSDHVNGAGIISRKLKIPIYFTRQTYSCCQKKIGKLTQEPVFFNVGDEFSIRDIHVTSFASSHDAIDSSNFVFQQLNNDNQKLAIATDLGFATKLLLEKIKEVTTLVLESNHDEVTLLTGPYPWELKQRVKSSRGHLSNKQAVAVVSQIIHNRLSNLVLAHLSEKNNTPELALKEMSDYLSAIKSEVKLFLADQYKPTPIIKV